jgi:hypothetical protein
MRPFLALSATKKRRKLQPADQKRKPVAVSHPKKIKQRSIRNESFGPYRSQQIWRETRKPKPESKKISAAVKDKIQKHTHLVTSEKRDGSKTKRVKTN